MDHRPAGGGVVMPGPTLRLAGRSPSAFHVWGVTGFAVAVALAVLLAGVSGLGAGWVVALAAVAAASFFGLAWTTRLVTGRETLTFYHHAAAVLFLGGGLMGVAGQPLLAWLDVVTVGLLAFLAFGRVGCLLVGCCHGRPTSGRGVRYDAAHAARGFSRALVGVPLVPTQAIEAVGVAVLMVTGAAGIGAEAQPGLVAATLLCAYGAGRFVLEGWRGDPVRAHAGPLSQAQLTAVVSVASLGELAAATGVGTLLVAALASLGVMTVAAPAATASARTALLHPRHVAELAALADRAHRDRYAPAPVVVTTSRGLSLSVGVAPTVTGRQVHYSLSRQPALHDRDATALAGLLSRLRHGGRPGAVVAGGDGVFHAVFTTR